MSPFFVDSHRKLSCKTSQETDISEVGVVGGYSWKREVLGQTRVMTQIIVLCGTTSERFNVMVNCLPQTVSLWVQ